MQTTSTLLISSGARVAPWPEDCVNSADNTERGDLVTLQTLSATSRWNLFKIEGQLDFAAAPTIATALVHAAALDQSGLLIDLEDVVSVDAIGVTQLTGTVRRLLAERPARQVAFVAKDTWLANTLASSQLPKSIVIFRSGSEALRAIKTHAAA
jgi:anti-anti-sigma regulatory factor